MLALLDRDITELVQDAGLIRSILQVIRGQLTPELQSAIIPIAYIEGRQLHVLQEKQRLADRTSQQSLFEQKEARKQEAIELKKQVDTLVDAPAYIDQEINRVKAKEAQLVKEQEETRVTNKTEEQKLIQLLETVEKMKKQLALKIRQTQTLHKNLNPIPGTIEEDNQQIKEVDELCLRAVKTIQQALGLL